MKRFAFGRVAAAAAALLAVSAPAWAQIELTGSYVPRMYEDFNERGPGSDMGDFTGVPMTDEARAKAQDKLEIAKIQSEYAMMAAQLAAIRKLRQKR